MTTIVVETGRGPLIIERAAIQGGMKLEDGRTLLLLSGRQIRTKTPISEIWPGVDIEAASPLPPGARDAEAESAIAAAVEQRKRRDAEAELQRAKAERAALALEEGRSAARAAQAMAVERAAREAAAAATPEPEPQARPKTAKRSPAPKRGRK